MSRIVRLREPSQPVLPLGCGPVHWDTLPSPVRERVLALWTQLLTEHLSRLEQGTADAIALLPSAPRNGEARG